MAEGVDTTVRAFTSDEVWEMARVGILGPDERVELLEGELVRVTPTGYAHNRVLITLTRILHERYGREWGISVQSTLGAGRDSLPEPDIAVVMDRGAWHVQRRVAGCGEAILLIEVSVTSRRVDRRKAAIYAQAAAPEYWIVDVPDRMVIVHRGPRPDGSWTEIRRVDADGTLDLPEGAGQLPVADVLQPDGPTG